MTAWLAQHLQTCKLTLQRLVQAPLGNLLTIGVMAIALSLPAGLLVLVSNLNVLAGNLTQTPQITVFLRPDASAAAVAQLRARLKADSEVASYTFIPKADALRQLAHSTGLQDLTDGLDGNPLPDAFVVRGRHPDAAALAQLRQAISQWPEVDQCQFDAQWAQRLEAILGLGRRLAALLGALLSFALVAIVANTIRLQILTRRAEIEVSSLIGATQHFIRRPFLYFGALQGLAAGLLGLGITAAGTGVLNREVTRLAALYGTHFQLHLLDAGDQLSLLLFAAWLGWLGAYLAAGSALRQVVRNA